jgi:hypothetical protein
MKKQVKTCKLFDIKAGGLFRCSACGPIYRLYTHTSFRSQCLDDNSGEYREFGPDINVYPLNMDGKMIYQKEEK